METRQFLALAAMVAAGFVVDSTLRLIRLRRGLPERRPLFDLRDFRILRSPGEYGAEEMRLVRRNMASGAVFLVLALVLLAGTPGGPYEGAG